MTSYVMSSLLLTDFLGSKCYDFQLITVVSGGKKQKKKRRRFSNLIRIHLKFHKEVKEREASLPYSSDRSARPQTPPALSNCQA